MESSRVSACNRRITNRHLESTVRSLLPEMSNMNSYLVDRITIRAGAMVLKHRQRGRFDQRASLGNEIGDVLLAFYAADAFFIP